MVEAKSSETEETSMKVLVTYQSLTGNTKKVAEAILEAIGDQKEMKELSQVTTLEGYDLAFVGFPIMGFGPSEEVKSFLANQAAGKSVALFITHASPEDSEPLKGWLQTCEDSAANTNLKAMFHCQGEMSEQIADLMVKSGDAQAAEWGKDRASTVGQPDAARVQRARDWAKKLAEG
jgi:flavodoxin